MEKIQKNSSTGFFGSELSLLAFQILVDMMSFLAQQQASLGGDRRSLAEPFE